MTHALVHQVNGGRILIVDDEEDNRELLQLVLNWEGFSTLTASSGEEALTMAADEPIDLVLLDLMMPCLDGFEVAARLKQNLVTRQIPIVVVSAMNDSATRKRVLETGALDLVSKPIDRCDLCARLRRILASQSNSRQARSLAK